MKMLRAGAFVVTLTLLVGATAGADDKEERGKLIERLGGLQQLLPPEAAEKLKLTDEQKKKLEELSKEFQEKQKEAFGKVADTVRKAIEDKDRAAVGKAIGEVREAVEKVRGEYLDKVAGILTDEQKKTFEEVKKVARRPLLGRLGGEGGRVQAPAPGQVLVPRVQEELKLTDEQKEKLAKLQKEVDAKLAELLTDEQKKKLEELKQGGNPPRRRRQPNNQ